MSDAKRNTGDRNTGYRNTGNKNTGNWNTGNKNTGNWNTGNKNTGNWNTGDWNTGYWNTGNKNTGNWNTGNWNTGDWNTGDWNTGDRNTGNWNTGDWNTGAFCIQNGAFTLFDKPTAMTREEFRGIITSLSSLPQLTLWIEEGYMSSKEKTANPTYKTTGGYLKKMDYKDAHRLWWKDLPEEDKKKITELPNFDANSFEFITGINVGNTDSDKKIELVKSKMAELEREMAALKKELEG
jgi:hypothetical protein